MHAIFFFFILLWLTKIDPFTLEFRFNNKWKSKVWTISERWTYGKCIGERFVNDWLALWTLWAWTERIALINAWLENCEHTDSQKNGKVECFRDCSRWNMWHTCHYYYRCSKYNLFDPFHNGCMVGIHVSFMVGFQFYSSTSLYVIKAQGQC